MSSDAMKMHILHTPIIFVECIVMKRSSESISVWNVAAHSRALLQTKHFSFNHIRGGKKDRFSFSPVLWNSCVLFFSPFVFPFFLALLLFVISPSLSSYLIAFFSLLFQSPSISPSFCLFAYGPFFFFFFSSLWFPKLSVFSFERNRKKERVGRFITLIATLTFRELWLCNTLSSALKHLNNPYPHVHKNQISETSFHSWRLLQTKQSGVRVAVYFICCFEIVERQALSGWMSGFGWDGWMMWWHVAGESCACWLEEWWKHYCLWSRKF